MTKPGAGKKAKDVARKAKSRLIDKQNAKAFEEKKAQGLKCKPEEILAHARKIHVRLYTREVRRKKKMSKLDVSEIENRGVADDQDDRYDQDDQDDQDENHFQISNEEGPKSKKAKLLQQQTLAEALAREEAEAEAVAREARDRETEARLRYVSIIAAVNLSPIGWLENFGQLVLARRSPTAPFSPACLIDPREEVVFTDKRLHATKNVGKLHLVYMGSFLDADLASMSREDFTNKVHFVALDNILRWELGIRQGYECGVASYHQPLMSRFPWYCDGSIFTKACKDSLLASLPFCEHPRTPSTVPKVAQIRVEGRFPHVITTVCHYGSSTRLSQCEVAAMINLSTLSSRRV